MKRYLVLTFMITGFLSLGACGSFKPGQQALVPSVAQFEILQPSVKTSAAGDSVEFTGTAQVKGQSYPFKMTGAVDETGMATLAPEDQNSPLRARLFCNGGSDPSHYTCDSLFVDVYFSTDSSLQNFLHTQLIPPVTMTQSTTASGASAAPEPPQPEPAPVAPQNSAPETPTTKVPSASAPQQVPPAAPAKPPAAPKSPVAPQTPAVTKPPAAAPKNTTPAAPKSPTVVVAPKTAPSANRPAPPVVESDDDIETDDGAGESDVPVVDGVFTGYQDKAQIRDLYTKPAVSTTQPGTTVSQDSKTALAHPQDQAVGCYAPVRNCPQGGRLNRASQLQKETNSYYLSAPGKNRSFGTYATVQFITWLSKKVQELLPSYRLRIGDVAQEKGGPIYSRDSQGRSRLAHNSHQNGLDADIGYIMDFKEGMPTLAISGGQMSSHVHKAEMWDIFKGAIHTQAVSRIFVDPAVKAGLCSLARAQGELESEREVLKRIQPLGGHQSHFHLRLRCPKDNPRCLDELLPANTPLGC